MQLVPNKIFYDGNKVVADDWYSIPKGYCRTCKQKIEHWKGEYFKVYFWVDEVHVRYAEDNGYCQACAMKHAEEKVKPLKLPKETLRTCDDHGRTIHYYDDGSTITDLQPDDLAKIGVRLE